MVKNISKTLGIIIIAWLILPTGDPSDILTFGIIAAIGFNAYFVLAVIVMIMLYKSIEGRTVSAKWNNVKREVGRLFK